MKINKSFGLFYGELVAVAKEAAKGKTISLGVLFEPASPEMIDWGSCAPSGISMAINLADSSANNDLCKPVMLVCRDRALARHREDMKLVQQGVLEICDVGYSAIMLPEKNTVCYYDICQRTGTVMTAVSLGKSIARITIVMHAENERDTFDAQRAVGNYIRQFLHKNNLGTMTDEIWPAT